MSGPQGGVKDTRRDENARRDEDTQRKWLRTGIGLTLLINGLLAAWVLARPALHHVPARAFLDVDYVLQSLGGVLAALFCFLPLGWGRPRRLPALLCGLGIGGYAAGQMYLTGYALLHGADSPSPSLADVSDLLAYPLLLAGLLALPARPISLAARLRISLDGLMVLTAAVTFSWRFILGPAFLQGHTALAVRVINVGYPLGDLVLLLCLLLVAARGLRPETRRAVAWLGFGLVAVVAVDTVETYGVMHAGFNAGTLVDVGWSLGYMPMGLAVAVLCQQGPEDRSEEEMDRLPPLWLSLLPYALLPAVGLLAIWAWRAKPAPALNGGVWAGALILVLLVMARQVMSILESRRLYGSLRLAHAEMSDSEVRYRQTFESNPAPMWVYDLHSLRFLAVNEAALQTYGYDRAEFLAMTLPELRPADEHDALWARLAAEAPHPFYRHETVSRHRTKGGRLLDTEITSSALHFGGVPARMVLAQDVTERCRLEAERERLLAEAVDQADRDPLTGLWNHRAFHRRFEEEADRVQRDGTSLAVVMLDLDNFKFFNDAYGHLAGDGVLRQVADALRGTCRSYDTLARFGGDEFALLLPLPDGSQSAEEISARLTVDLGGLTFLPPGQDTPMPLTLSFGVALFPQEAAGRADLVPLADERLFRAKSGGADDDEAECLRRHLLSSIGGYAMLDALLVAVDNKDRYTRRHSEDVLTYSLEIAHALGLPAEALTATAVAALLHDVGKIGIPDRILRKPGKLTDDEYESVQKHPMMGAVIVGAVPGFEDTLDAIRHHHERWDGKGYPDGLVGEETPLMARLMAVADAYSAMTTDRPYRKGMEPGKALGILEEGAGTQWDPVCVRAFLTVRTVPAHALPSP